jgi:LPXTG-site transpeptidase (sortase) family protein
MLKVKKIKTILKKINTTPGGKLILAGVILLLVSTGYQTLSLIPKNSPKATATEESAFQAKKIIIPKAKINASITQGGFVDGQWILSDNSVLIVTQDEGQKGTFSAILYAHNRPELFANLKKVSLKDKIIIENEKNEQIVYEVYSKESVRAKEVDKIQSSDPNSLILFTCNGLFDQSRLLVKARLIS